MTTVGAVRLDNKMCGERGNHVIGTVTVVRVGRAVFYIDRREQYDDGVPTDERTVAAFIPTLAKAFS